MKHSGTLLQAMLLALVCWNTAVAEEEFQDIEIETIHAGDGIYILTGKGGNGTGPD